MTIKEKLTTLGLGANQTSEILWLLTQSYIHGYHDAADMAGIKPIPDIVAEQLFKVVDAPYRDFGGEYDLTKFSAVFRYDFGNDIP